MALHVCLACSTAFAVGLARCPHCQNTDFAEQGAMPKITRSGGPSSALTEEVPSSPGNSSSTSQPKPQTSDEQNSPTPRKRARTTGSRSRKPQAGDSTARSTATDGPADD